jgi:hypothetical protein
MPTMAETRLANTLALLDAFKAELGPNADDLHGVEAAFARKLEISQAQWIQLKRRHRSVGEKLARQFEAKCGRPKGWLDESHPATTRRPQASPPLKFNLEPATSEERFAVDLFLTAFRSNPEGVKARLLDVVHAELAKRSSAASSSPVRVASSRRGG